MSELCHGENKLDFDEMVNKKAKENQKREVRV
jgi:hypothetical protein